MSSLKEFLTSIESWTSKGSVLFVQKWVTEFVFSLLSQRSGFGRKWFTQVGENLLLQVKSIQDILVWVSIFPGRDLYLVTWTDVLRKGEVRGNIQDTIIETIPSKEVWWSESTLSVFGQSNSLDRMIARDKAPDIIYTRWAPTLTREAVEKAYPWEEVIIYEVDGNTEAYVALQSVQSPEKIVCGTEFVQTGSSLIATGSYILWNDAIYAPRRDDQGKFESAQSYNASKTSTFAKQLTLDVNVVFARIFPNQ